LTKITLLNPNVSQPNVSYYEPNPLPEYNKAKSMYNQQNPILVNSGTNHQVYSDPIMTNSNNNYGQNIMTQNQNGNGNMNNAFNNIINLTQIGNANQSNDYSLTNMNNYNGMNNINNMSNINAVQKLQTLNSMNSHNSTSNLDTTITNMTNLSYYNDFNNVNLSNASTMSNISNMSNSQPVSNPITNQSNPSNNYAKQQNNNGFASGYNNYNNNNPMLYLNYYLSMMNYPLQYNNKFEQDLTANASFAPYLNNSRSLEFNPQEIIINSEEPFNKVKEVKQTKSKSAGKRTKQVNNVNVNLKNTASMLDLLEDKKVLESINELNFDILELYNPPDDLIGFKRKGIPNIQDFDSLLKKRQLDNQFGIN